MIDSKLLVVETETERQRLRLLWEACGADGEWIEAADLAGAIAVVSARDDLQCVFLGAQFAATLPSAIASLQAAGNGIPVAILGEDSELATMRAALDAGASDYLVKSQLTPETLWLSWQRSQRLMQATQARDRQVLSGSKEGIWDWNVGAATVRGNAYLQAALGWPDSDSEIELDTIWQQIHPRDRRSVRRAILAHLYRREALEVEFRWQATNGEYRYWLLRGNAQLDESDRRQHLCGVVVDITESRHSEERSRFLAEASQLLSASLDSQAPLENLARLAVPRLADWCAIDLVEPEGAFGTPARLKRVAVAHVNPHHVALLWDLQNYEHPDFARGAAFQTREAQAYFEVTTEQLKQMAIDENHLAILQRLSPRSYLCVPLQAGDRLLGILTFACGESARHYTCSDLILVEDLARRTALAMENARLYQEAQEASNSLRKTLWILGEQQQQLRTLQQLANLLNQRLSNLPELLQVMAESTCAAIAGAQVCAIALYDETDDRLLLTAAAGQGVGTLQLEMAFAEEGGILQPVFATGQAQSIENASLDERLPRTLYAVAIESVQAGRLGVLAVGNWDSGTSFNDEARNLLTAVGEQAAIAIDNARSIEILEEREERLEAQNQILAEQNLALEEQQQQIRVQNLKLLEAARLKSQFLAMMSHELRTPMNAIIGFSQLLLRQAKGALTSSQQQMLERILSNGKMLLGLINDILDLSKMEAGRMELRLETFDIVALVRTTIEELRSLADEKQLYVRLKSSLEGLQVTNDRIRTRQIIVNLLSNAIKFTETGGIEIGLELVGSERVAIAVTDTGIGMSPDQMASVFEEFWQADQTTTRKYSGTGLGLAIADSLVQLMRGRITVASKVGTGSTFRVELPRRVPTTAERSPDSAAAIAQKIRLREINSKPPKRRLY